jgi:hypothetical protein
MPFWSEQTASNDPGGERLGRCRGVERLHRDQRDVTGQAGAVRGRVGRRSVVERAGDGESGVRDDADVLVAADERDVVLAS